MSPYAAFTDGVFPLQKPSEADLIAAAQEHAPTRLLIFDYRFADLTPLSIFPNLEILKMKEAANLTSLRGLEIHTGLKYLVMQTPNSWDAKKKCIEIDSYQPLRHLVQLERMVLTGLRAANLDLSPILAMTWLKELEFDGVPEFGLEQMTMLAAALPNTTGRSLKPYFTIEGVGGCKKCKTWQVLLTAPPPRVRWLCPVCKKKRVDEHEARWNEAKARALEKLKLKV